jgi:hypothetical protein
MPARISGFHMREVSARDHHFHALPLHIDQGLVERMR